jgi:hypothetical protein
MKAGALMMDTREAITSLNGYSETLVGLSVLLGSKLFEEKDDEQIRMSRDRLLAQIKETRTNGKWMALEVMKEIHQVGTKADDSGCLIGITAAMERYVAADSQASDALGKLEKKAPSSTASAIQQFREKHKMFGRVKT